MPQNERKIIYAMLCSLDGYIAGPDGNFDWAEPDEEVHRHFNAWEGSIDTYLYGRVMYELMNAFWPTAADNPEHPSHIVDFANMWNKAHKVVFSTTLNSVGENATLVNGNITETVAKLRAQPGQDMAVGGATLASAFQNFGLIDEYHVYINPVVVGGGLPMFKDVINIAKLKHIETHTFSGGTVLLKYQPVR